MKEQNGVCQFSKTAIPGVGWRKIYYLFLIVQGGCPRVFTGDNPRDTLAYSM